MDRLLLELRDSLRRLEELDLELLEDEVREELRLEGLETEGEELRLEGLETEREELRLEGLETEREELRLEGLETEREELRLEGLETEREELRLEGLETEREELRLEGLETEREELRLDGLETEREVLRLEGLEIEGDGRLELGALRTLDEDRGGKGREGVETRSESVSAGRGEFTGPLMLRPALLRPRTAAGRDGEGRLRGLLDPAVDLLPVVLRDPEIEPGAERIA